MPEFALNQETLMLGLVWYAIFIVSVTLHEAAHALAAWKLGDPTAYEGGQVTLNPLPHIEREPIGTILVPIISFVMYRGAWMIGWASIPYDPYWAHRYPARAFWMSLAGPAANLLLAVLAGLAIRIGLETGHFIPPPDGFGGIDRVVAGAELGPWNQFARLLSIMFVLNLLLLVLNILPLPPLDGSAIWPLVLSPSYLARYRELAAQPVFSLLGLVVAWRLLPAVFAPVFAKAYALLYAGIFL